jgi:hypothetical protein
MCIMISSNKGAIAVTFTCWFGVRDTINHATPAGCAALECVGEVREGWRHGALVPSCIHLLLCSPLREAEWDIWFILFLLQNKADQRQVVATLSTIH